MFASLHSYLLFTSDNFFHHEMEKKIGKFPATTSKINFL